MSDRKSAAPKRARVPRKATKGHLENAALWYLTRYQATARSLERVLMRRVFRSAKHHGTDAEEGADFVAELLKRYRESGLLDDGAFARARAATLHSRGLSRRAITARLKEKGVADSNIEAALAQLADDDPDGEPELYAARRTARRRRLGPWRAAPGRTERREKDLAALARAGFSYDIAKQVIDGET